MSRDHFKMLYVFVLPAVFFTSFTVSSEALNSEELRRVPVTFLTDALSAGYETLNMKNTCSNQSGQMRWCQFNHGLWKREDFNRPITFWADNQTGEIELPVGNMMKDTIPNGSACSYTVLATENNGFRIHGGWNDDTLGIEGCFYKKNRFTSHRSPVVTITNDSAHTYYMDMLFNDRPMVEADSSDVEFGAGAIKMFTGDLGVGKINNMVYGDKIDISFDDIRCPTIPSLTNDVDYRISPERTCEISPQLSQGTRLKKGTSDILTIDQANDEGFKILYKTPDNQDAEDYYLVVIKEDRSKFGSYVKIKSGVEAEYRARVYKNWHPDGGKFIIGISKNADNPGSVEFIGDTIKVSTVD